MSRLAHQIELGRPSFGDRALIKLAGRYFAGADVPAILQNLKARKGPVIFDLMGEAGNAAGTVSERMDRTMALGDLFVAEGINARIAVRPGQFGGDTEKMLMVVAYLNSIGIRTRIDMETNDVITPTINAYKRAATSQHGAGMSELAIQAYIFRTMPDLIDIIDFALREGIRIDIGPVRGVYIAKHQAELRDVALMHESLAKMLHMLATCGVTGVYVHTASHHPFQVARALKLRQIFGSTVAPIEWLTGVYRPDGPMEQAVRVFTPGAKPDESVIDWYRPGGPNAKAYLMRRLTETGNVVLTMTAASMFERRNARLVMYLMNECELDVTKPELPFVDNVTGRTFSSGTYRGLVKERNEFLGQSV